MDSCNYFLTLGLNSQKKNTWLKFFFTINILLVFLSKRKKKGERKRKKVGYDRLPIESNPNVITSIREYLQIPIVHSQLGQENYRLMALCWTCRSPSTSSNSPDSRLTWKSNHQVCDSNSFQLYCTSNTLNINIERSKN